MTNGAPSSVASAAFRALAAWLVIHVVISQLMVIPKWNLSSKNVVKSEQQEVVVETPEPAVTINDTLAKEKEKAEMEKTRQEQQQRIQLVQRLIDDAKEVQSRHEQVVASTVQHLEGLRDKVMKPLSRGEPPAQPSLVSPRLVFFKELLELATLSDIDETKLLELSRRMKEEVDTIVMTNATVSWPDVSSVVTARYERRDPEPRSCPSTTTPQVDPSFARESHLYQQFQQTEKALKRRAEAMPPLLHPDAVTEELQRQASNPPPETKQGEDDGDDRMCVSQQDVVDMMDEGVNAIQRRLDVRRVLTNHLLSTFDVSEADLILDAPLDPPTQNMPATKPITLNLRQVMDTPLLKEMERWIDAALDHVGGHFDSLDQLVDKLAADNSSVGKALMSKLQTLAGKVEIPNVWAQVPTKAGILKASE
jgi:hypothetical protein